ncbi:hypothetical protein [Methylobacterium gnaphalii]|uniref:Uncharacterized protein n=1 Tax=Methylobacterium gnaphalii TaxID=1010610 RepID=A0A512JIG9_9HYPH|nr:hypothetical protein [Methylobacterium gnaphalii]GEP09758.1 hypothetical protein MGN01_16030 [Methylobacterium gnaphalii]GJD67326.1 hypothetical protein MMMDOFMJ_0240 [Methylobacterium gnaphalii]GLS51366.1 hypothetical protein GCM10007885_42230 [Methylobacterium gnaphalii]
MRRTIWAITALTLLAAPAAAQSLPSDPTAVSLGGTQTGLPGTANALANPGQLSLSNQPGTAGGGSGAAGIAGSATNAGQLDFSRTNGTGGAPTSSGAGIASGSAGTSQANDTYLYPLYGRHF